VLAIIPVAGLGTRLRPHTLERPKVLLHVAGRPILGHILDEMLAAGIHRVVLVVGYLGEQIREWVDRHYGHRLQAAFVEQGDPLGNGHAVYVAREYLSAEPVLLLFGDTIIRAHLPELLARSESAAGVKTVDDPRRFGIAEVDAEGYIRRLVEKPEVPTSHLALTGLYLIRNAPLLREALERMVREDRRQRGEFWLVDALQLMLEAGELMRPFPITHWYDCGTIEALLQANRALLALDSPPLPSLPDVVLIPPVAVSPQAEITRSVVGPYVSVGPGARVSGAVVRDSIIQPDAIVEDAVVSGAVIAEGARVSGPAAALTHPDPA
jgi:glucose-1-phosphate thymidylyltransferase